MKLAVNTNRAMVGFSAASRRKPQTECLASPFTLNDIESDISKSKIQTIKSRKNLKNT